MSTKINQLPKVEPVSGDLYVVYDQSTGKAATTEVLLESDIVDLVSGGGLLTKDGFKLVSKDNSLVQVGDLNVKAAAPISYGTVNDSKQERVYEFGQMINPSGSWNTNEISVGGTVFKWSAAANNTGHLMWRRAANTSAPNSSASSQLFVVKTIPGTAPTNADSQQRTNANPYSTDWVDNSTSPSITGPYHMVEYHISTSPSGTTNSQFYIRVMSTGWNTLSVHVEYWGPRIFTTKGTI